MLRAARIACLLLFAFAVPAFAQEKAKTKVPADVAALINERMPTDKLQVRMQLSEMVQLINGFLQRKAPEAYIVVDGGAFSCLGGFNAAEAPVQLPPNQPKDMPIRDILRLVVNYLAARDGVEATFLLRDGFIEITTAEAAHPSNQRVFARFDKTPLADALDEMSRRTGATIVIDCRAAEKSRVPVSAYFRSGAPLFTAVKLLADAAGLRAELIDNVIHVALSEAALPKADGESASVAEPARQRWFGGRILPWRR